MCVRTHIIFLPPLLVPALLGWASSGRLPCPVRASSPLRSLGGRACVRVVAFGVARGCGVFGSPPPRPPSPRSGRGEFFGRPSGCSGWRLPSRSFFGCRRPLPWLPPLTLSLGAGFKQGALWLSLPTSPVRARPSTPLPVSPLKRSASGFVATDTALVRAYWT